MPVVNLRKVPYDVYIGRSGKGQDGYFGNPCIVGKVCIWCQQVHTTGADTLPCYKSYLYTRCEEDFVFRTKIEELRGKTLGCFCKPNPCHGDIIEEYLNFTKPDSFAE